MVGPFSWMGVNICGLWWAVEDLNLRPSARQADALPTELTAHDVAWRRRPESNRGMRALQAPALPLGDAAQCSEIIDRAP